jgi:hypothetical protein
MPMWIRSAARVTLLTVALIVLLAGCSDNRTAEVAGTVSVDGQPVEKGSISFIPADGKGVTAGSDIKDGKYVATGVSLGTAKIQIRVPKVTGKKMLYDDKNVTRDTFSESLPKKYNDDTELRFDVQPGKNEKNWDISTK